MNGKNLFGWRGVVSRALLVAWAALGAFGAKAAPVDASAARQAADAFLERRAGRASLPGRTVADVAAHGNVWIVALAPSGHLLVSGSDRTTPVLGFSAADFEEPEAGSPAEAALAATEAAVAEAEADASRTRHAKWDAAPSRGASARTLAAETVVEPFIAAHYNQCQPFNDLTPMVTPSETGPYRGRSLAGCVSVADAALVRTVGWPVYPARTDTVTHAFRGSTFDIRFDGSAPFNYSLMRDAYAAYGDQRGSLPEDARYEIARLLMWLNHSARMTYNAGESTSTKYNAAHGGERDWYTIGRSMTPDAEGVAEIVVPTLSAGIPVFVGVGGHAVVADGWQTDGDEAFVDLLYGWGGPGSWYSVADGPVRYFWVEHYPRAKPQLDPVPRVIGGNVTLSWRFPDCYADSLAGFIVTKRRRTSAAPETWTADFSDEAAGQIFPAGAWSTIEDGGTALYGGEDVRGWYQFATPLTVSADSVLSLEVRGGVDRDNIIVEICGEDGNWAQLLVPAINWAYWPGSWRESSCSLAAYAGQTVQLRIYKADVLYNGQTAIRNFRVTHAVPLAGEVSTTLVAGADVRSATLTELEAGADYAFSVLPWFSGETLTTAEPSDAKIATVEGTHAIPGPAVDAIVDQTVEAASLPFSESFQITEDSTLSCAWNADCSAGGIVQLRVTFTPEGGDEVALYASEAKMKMEGVLDQSGDYTESGISLATYAGVAGTLNASILTPYGAPYDDIATSAVQSMTVTNVHVTGLPETETLTARALPEFTVIQYAANGLSAKDVTDGYLADGSIGSSTLYVTCSGDVTSLAATPSHVELVQDEDVHVEHLSDGRWRVTFDPAIPEARARQRMLLTLHATDANGTVVHRDVVLRMTADSGIEGGAVEEEYDSGNYFYTPSAQPIAVWNGDFGTTVRGAVTLNAQGNTVAADGSTVTKAAGQNGIDFAVTGGSAPFLVVAGVSGISTPESGSAILLSGVASGGGASAISLTSDGKHRIHEGTGSGQWQTGADADSLSGRHAIAMLSNASGTSAYVDGEKKQTAAGLTPDSAVTDVVLGGWRDSADMEMAGTTFNYVAVFSDASASEADISIWNLKNMTGAVTLPAAGGELTSVDTGRDLGVNLNGGTVTLAERVYAAALFVQEDTTLDVALGGGIAGARLLYVAPGKTLTLNVSYDATALANQVAAGDGVYTTRLLQGAIYGDIEAGSLPDLGALYRADLVKDGAKGVSLRVALRAGFDEGVNVWTASHATDGTYRWDDTANWSLGVLPGGEDPVAAEIGGNTTLTLPEGTSTVGPLTVCGTGTLTVEGAWTSSSAIVLDSEAEAGVVLKPAGTATLSGAISGLGALEIAGSVSLSAANTYSGGTIVTGTLTISDAEALGSGALYGTSTGVLRCVGVAPANRSGLSAGSWSGTVRLEDLSGTAAQGLVLSDLGHSGTTIVLKDFGSATANTYFGGTQAVAANLVLEGNNYFTNGYSAATVTFSGAVSGSGNLYALPSANMAETWCFTGDLSGFLGALAATGTNRNGAETANIRKIVIGGTDTSNAVSGGITIAGDLACAGSFSGAGGVRILPSAEFRTTNPSPIGTSALSGGGDLTFVGVVPGERACFASGWRGKVRLENLTDAPCLRLDNLGNSLSAIALKNVGTADSTGVYFDLTNYAGSDAGWQAHASLYDATEGVMVVPGSLYLEGDNYIRNGFGGESAWTVVNFSGALRGDGTLTLNNNGYNVCFTGPLGNNFTGRLTVDANNKIYIGRVEKDYVPADAGKIVIGGTTPQAPSCVLSAGNGIAIESGATLTVATADTFGGSAVVGEGVLDWLGAFDAPDWLAAAGTSAADGWRGVLKRHADIGTQTTLSTLSAYGNAESTIWLASDCTCHFLSQAGTCNSKLVLDGTLVQDNGWSTSGGYTFTNTLTGSGILRTTQNQNNANVWDCVSFTGDTSGFSGTVEVGGGHCIAFGSGVVHTSANKDHTNQLVVQSGSVANIASGKTWTAAGGIVVNGTLGGQGAIGAGTALTFADGATLDATAGVANASPLTLASNTVFAGAVAVKLPAAPAEAGVKVLQGENVASNVTLPAASGVTVKVGETATPALLAADASGVYAKRPALPEAIAGGEAAVADALAEAAAKAGVATVASVTGNPATLALFDGVPVSFEGSAATVGTVHFGVTGLHWLRSATLGGVEGDWIVVVARAMTPSEEGLALADGAALTVLTVGENEALSEVPGVVSEGVAAALGVESVPEGTYYLAVPAVASTTLFRVRATNE